MNIMLGRIATVYLSKRPKRPCEVDRRNRRGVNPAIPVWIDESSEFVSEDFGDALVETQPNRDTDTDGRCAQIYSGLCYRMSSS